MTVLYTLDENGSRQKCSGHAGHNDAIWLGEMLNSRNAGYEPAEKIDTGAGVWLLSLATAGLFVGYQLSRWGQFSVLELAVMSLLCVLPAMLWRGVARASMIRAFLLSREAQNVNAIHLVRRYGVEMMSVSVLKGDVLLATCIYDTRAGTANVEACFQGHQPAMSVRWRDRLFSVVKAGA